MHTANTTCSPPHSQLHNNSNFTAIADTGASHHYCHSGAPVHTFTTPTHPTTVTIANGDCITSSGHAKLLLPNLPPGTDHCHIMSTFPNNLLSIGRFCDANCKVVFTTIDVQVLDDSGAVVLQGFREPTGARM